MNNKFGPFGTTPQDRRKYVADFICAHREEIKEGFRARIAAGEPGFYDSSDFFSTVQRRADHLAAVEDEETSRDILRMLHEIMMEALADHARMTMRERQLRRKLAASAPPPPEPAAIPTRELAESESLKKQLCLSDEDLNLAKLRASGLLHRQVAAALGVSASVVRMRWLRLVGKAEQAWSQASG